LRPPQRDGVAARRILFISPSATIGGAERSLLELVGGLPAGRFDPYLLLPRDGPLADAARGAGAHVSVIPWPSPLLRLGRERTLINRVLPLFAPLLMVPVLVRIARFVRGNRIDLLHTNGTKSHLASWPASVVAGIPLVWHIRDVLAPGSLRSVMRLLGRVLPSTIIANSLASAGPMMAGARDGNVRVVYNGLDPATFRRADPDPGLRASLGIQPSSFVIGALGALSPLKGHIHLIRAMPEVLRSIPEARLVIVGDEMYDTAGHQGYRAFLQAEIKRLGLEGRVVLAGRREEIVPLYNLMDMVVNSSVRPESFGRTLIEAMACERPVISTDLGGPREIIRDPEHGIFVPPADPAALAGSIIELHGDPARREAMGRAGRRRVMDAFTLERHVAEVCEVYDRLLGPGHA
jgi:glycosyltransferase involved in cell wall biosynthesis